MAGGKSRQSRQQSRSESVSKADAAEGRGERSPSRSVLSVPSARPMRIGDILVHMGVMTPAQRDGVLAAQRSAARPFGVLAEEMFGVSPGAVERAWAAQFAQMAPRIDAATVQAQPRALEMISRRQAWQFRVLPVQVLDGELIAATTEECLPRAMRFMGWRCAAEVSFVISDASSLGVGLVRHYPIAGMTPDDVPLRPAGAKAC